jgi:hypothetical protein
MIIGLSGAIGAGKDTVADILVADYGFRKYSLIQPVINAACKIFDVPEYFFTDRDYKGVKSKALMGKTPRDIMRTLGTEWGRNLIDEQIWLKLADSLGAFQGDVVISAIRFDNEVEYVKRATHSHDPDNEFKCWHIIRPGNPFAGDMSSHASDMGLDEVYIDEVLVNGGSLESLASAVHTSLPEKIRRRYKPFNKEIRDMTMSLEDAERYGYVKNCGGSVKFSHDE